ncbi:glutathione S-transferase family protein [Saccharobesus litoralis]|uniref:glutathione transferase n=1 Tax=Saccharobesus litoralis TaxID=2172099 RepID=A0A2S0VRP2_9ALTE|nr:glutathione S-transferase family protein [Saccharobesus litoralis]AWB66863.1 glutathione S-transferase family protein [Saccharobesus litoralis]
MLPIELVSFKLCPFVQRSVITLKQKNIEFAITYIDLADKPDWFLAMSPLGKVPVLKYGDEVLFESAVINEFLDEITPPTLMPYEPINKAKDRAWIEYTSQCLMNQYTWLNATNAAEEDKQQTALHSKLTRLEAQVPEQGFFNGDDFSLVDSSLAPFFHRFAILQKQKGINILANYPKLQALSEQYMALDSVTQSVVADFDSLFIDYFAKQDSYIVNKPNA